MAGTGIINDDETKRIQGNVIEPFVNKVSGIVGSYAAGARGVAGDISQAAKSVATELTKPIEPAPGQATIGSVISSLGPPKAPEVKPLEGPRAWAPVGAGGGVVPGTSPETTEATKFAGVVTQPPGQESQTEGVVKKSVYTDEDLGGPGRGAYGGFPSAAGGGGIVPTGARGYEGFASSYLDEVERNKKQQREYEAKLEEDTLAGLGRSGQERMRERIKMLEPYLEGVSKGRRAKVMAGFLGALIKEQDEAKRTMMGARTAGEATKEAANVRAAATQQAAYSRAKTEAQKMGLDIARLGLDEKRFALESIKDEANMRKAMLEIKNNADKNALEALKIKVSQARNEGEANQAKAAFVEEQSHKLYTAKVNAAKLKYGEEGIYTNPVAVKELSDALVLRNYGARNAALINPTEGMADPLNPNLIFKGGKFVEVDKE